MADEITTTEAAVFIPEIWRPGFLKALKYKSKIRNRVLNADGDVAKMGDILHIRIAPSGTVNNVTAATGAVTNQALTATEAQLTVNAWKDYTFSIVDNVDAQADQYLKAALEDSAPQAFAKAIDSDIFDLQSNLTSNTALDATGGVTAEILSQAVYTLATRDIDMEDPNNITWFFHWKEWPTLKNLAQLSQAQITGVKGGLMEFKVPDIVGIPCMFSNEVTYTSSEYKNLLCHKETFACGVQRNFNMERFARTQKATTYSADMMYGVKTVRATHGIVIRTA